MEAFDSSAFLSDESHEKEGDLFEAVEGCEPVESLTLSLSLFLSQRFQIGLFHNRAAHCFTHHHTPLRDVKGVSLESSSAQMILKDSLSL